MDLLGALLPAACVGCGRYGALLCASCTRTLRPPGHDIDRFLAPDPAVVVGEALEVGVAAFAYEGPLRRALAGLKYGGAGSVAGALAAHAEGRLAILRAMATGAALVPVPVHIERRRQRGYNQAELLARALASRTGFGVADVLIRERATTQQHRLDRAARLRNLRHAFALRPAAPPPRVAILVDDILTTAATLEACAGILREAGTTRVLGFAIAREV
jgi:ComF family protein